MKEFYQTKEGDYGLRVDIVLAGRLGHTRSYWQKQLKAGSVTVSGRPVKPGHIVERGNTLEVDIPVPDVASPDLPVLYQDEYLMIVDKPAGLLVHPKAGAIEAAVSHFAAKHSNDTDQERPGIVHRLDRQTSGLLILAKDAATKAYLQNQFKARQVHKTYLALVSGHLKSPHALIDLPVGRSLKHPTKHTVTPLGRQAATGYRVLREWPGFSLLEVHPVTGRTHQIRVHFSHLGHPVVGDSLYGNKNNQFGLARHFLHASHVEFVGPKGSKVEVGSPLPDDLQRTLDQLDKRYNS